MNKLRLAALSLLFALMLSYYVFSRYLEERRELNFAIINLGNTVKEQKYFIAYRSVSLPHKRDILFRNMSLNERAIEITH